MEQTGQATLTKAPLYTGPIFDGDTHLRETPDDWRVINGLLPAKFRKDWSVTSRRADDGEFAMHIGERKIEVTAGYQTEDGRVSPPGRLHEWLRAIKEGKADVDMRVPRTPDMSEPAARLAKLDEWGVAGALVFPGDIVATMGYLDEVEPSNALLHAYNQWLEGKWGFNFHDRCYPAPIIDLTDLDAAVREAEWVVRQGVRIVLMPMGPVNNRAPADPRHDRFWSVLNEAAVRIAFHTSESPYMHTHMRIWGETPMESRLRQSAFTWMNFYSERPVIETLSSFVFYNFFDRFANLKLISVENGAEWVPGMLRKMDRSRGFAKNSHWPCGQLSRRPSEIFKDNISVVAYPEDDVKEIIRKAGTSKFLVMGSDYPHSEGVPTPREFVKEAMADVPAADISAIMYDNGRAFMPLERAR